MGLLSDLPADADQSARQAQAVAQKLLRTLAEPYTLTPQTDPAMYRAKEAGRNAVHYATTESSVLPPPASTQATPA